jgi:1,4-dihydroxy-2-naphthoyl-CoA hydrolase
VQERDLTLMPAEYTPVVPFDECFDAVYGLEVDSRDLDDGVVRGHVEVRDELLAAHGAVHGGVLAALAEALASRGTAMAVIPHGFAAMGQSNDTTVLAAVSDGAIHCAARVVDRGAGAWLWVVDATDGDGAPVAFSRVTVAVRPLRP